MIAFIGLDNKTYKLDTRESKYPMRPIEGCKSKLQFECGQLIKKKFPLTPILEEVQVPNHNLIFDFFLPTFKMVFEIDGKQHSEFNKFFHKNKRNFLNAKLRDDNKELLCSINGWHFIRVRSISELEEKLND